MKPLSWKEVSNEESYEDHVNSVLELWRGKFKNTHLPSLSRILTLDGEYVNNLVEVSIILHDTGKLFLGYQEALRGKKEAISRGEYRHEIVSAALTFFIVSADELYLTSGAILLHHEPILMGQVGRYAERYLTITDIERRLRKTCGDTIEFDSEGIDWTCKKLQNYPFNKYIPEEIKVDDALEKIKELMLILCVKCSPQRRASLRLKVSSLGTLLSILDSVAANKNRKLLDGGGTFITKRAEKAEVSLAWL
ncbi:hypothetical protein KEJ27_08890 [Candidatus Bathyarchaeota archaeon]|nr:hypothetical protein [Candidatus Bathyarchaeota archaeon]MBS7618154.1 hypothetical protein [Candidatus Bathyarchaeota archaeon]